VQGDGERPPGRQDGRHGAGQRRHGDERRRPVLVQLVWSNRPSRRARASAQGNTAWASRARAPVLTQWPHATCAAFHRANGYQTTCCCVLSQVQLQLLDGSPTTDFLPPPSSTSPTGPAF